MNILVLAPHPDDESIGCGGAILNHVAVGDRVSAVFLTSGELGLKDKPREEAWRIREGEAQKAGRVLGLSKLCFLRQPDWYLNKHIRKAAKALVPVLQAEAPQLVYLPHPAEWHPDHKAAGPILRLAYKGFRGRKPELRGYEVWTPLGMADEVVDISAVIERKLRAVRAHKSQSAEFDYARAIKGLNQYRGELGGRCGYAEVFQVLKLGRL